MCLPHAELLELDLRLPCVLYCETKHTDESLCVLTCFLDCPLELPAASAPEPVPHAPAGDMAPPKAPELAEQHLISMDNVKMARDVTVC